MAVLYRVCQPRACRYLHVKTKVAAATKDWSNLTYVWLAVGRTSLRRRKEKGWGGAMQLRAVLSLCQGLPGLHGAHAHLHQSVVLCGLLWRRQSTEQYTEKKGTGLQNFTGSSVAFPQWSWETCSYLLSMGSLHDERSHLKLTLTSWLCEAHLKREGEWSSQGVSSSDP